MLDAFSLPFMQRGALEVLVLAVAAGVIGTWVVLRGLAFYSHAVGTAAFPGLVLADGIGFSAHLGAGVTAGIVAVLVALLTRREHDDALTAVVLIAALVAGIVLASDVFASGANVDTLLFGSLLTIGTDDVLWAAAAAVLVLAGAALLGRRWTAAGFDPGSAHALGVRSRASDAVLLALVALVAVVSLSAVGALLATALLVVPAVTTRLVVDRLGPWRVATVVLAAAQGLGGLWLAYELNAPPGATIAALGAAVFAVVALVRLRGGRALLAGAAASVAIAGCGGGGDGSAGTSGLRVVATTTQLGDVARAVGGDEVGVTQLLQPNTDPHDYEPRPEDVKAVAEADVVLASGDGLDEWVSEVVEQSGGDPEVVDVGAQVPHRLPGEGEHDHEHAEEEGHDHAEEDEHDHAEEEGHDHGDSAFDPHWWHDPRNMGAAATIAADAFAAADADLRTTVDERAKGYQDQIAALDRDIQACMADVPAGERKLVTDHDAFNYFTERYDITVVGAVIPSQTTQAQTSARDVAELADLIREEGVRAVFPESSVNDDVARAIADQTGASADAVLYGDTLGPAGSDGATYIESERHNAVAMVRGFTGGETTCSA